MLAGGGHTHALLLKRWAMHPHLRPNCLITLVNRESTTIYSGMFPGLIASQYHLEEVLIDLRRLSHRAGVSLIVGEITLLDLSENRLFLDNRPPISFTKLSLDVGSETHIDNATSRALKNKKLVCPIKPFRKSYEWIKSIEGQKSSDTNLSLTVVGSGLAALEIVFALRKRWPLSSLRLQCFHETLKPSIRNVLAKSHIELADPMSIVPDYAIICTGSKGPNWLQNSGLNVNELGRVSTNAKLQVEGLANIFAAGDCGVISKHFRPPSGVWAVRAAGPLARNLERSLLGKPLLHWKPQFFALQLLGGFGNSNLPSAWIVWWRLMLGPNSLIWKLKKRIDKKFMAAFSRASLMENKNQNLPCRGCAAKIAAHPLKSALKSAGLVDIAENPEDAACVKSSLDKGVWLQSVDGFPALLSDPWLNARITTLHACSDLWARGLAVSSAQAIISIPTIHKNLQQEILTQCLSGIQSALEPQGANLIGGHTFESRSELLENISLGIEVSLSINGFDNEASHLWSKEGMQPGDEILLSRPLGIGVIFAASMNGVVDTKYVDNALLHLTESQHVRFEDLQEKSLSSTYESSIHACTDITGFGLLGHLGEMIKASNANRLKEHLPLVKVNLFGSDIPALPGVKDLFKAGYESTLAPSNRMFLELLDSNNNSPPLIELSHGNISTNIEQLSVLRQLLVDPQTCGPLVISCEQKLANYLIKNNSWHRIGSVDFI